MMAPRYYGKFCGRRVEKIPPAEFAGSTDLSSVEIFDPASGQWRGVSRSLCAFGARRLQTVLPSGAVENEHALKPGPDEGVLKRNAHYQS